MKIIQTPSPNFDDRTLPIALLVLHYTGMESGTAALSRMLDPEAKVSAHYMVSEDGKVSQLVTEDKRAWHAGVSEWRGETNINSNSIGIEIVNGGHNCPNPDGSLPEFPDVQINAVIALSKDILKRHALSSMRIVGHSDIAPARKIDPGEHFPWAGLAAAGIGFWPQDLTDDTRILFEPGDRDRGVSALQSGLAYIGYGARITGVLDANTTQIIQALQRRFRPARIDGIVDMQTMDIVKKWVEALNVPTA